MVEPPQAGLAPRLRRRAPAGVLRHLVAEPLDPARRSEQGRGQPAEAVLAQLALVGLDHTPLGRVHAHRLRHARRHLPLELEMLGQHVDVVAGQLQLDEQLVVFVARVADLGEAAHRFEGGPAKERDGASQHVGVDEAQQRVGADRALVGQRHRGQLAGRRVEGELVAVEERVAGHQAIGARTLGRVEQPLDQVGRHDVVVVQKSDEVRAAGARGRVARGIDPAVLLPQELPAAWLVTRPHPLEQVESLRLLRPVIHHDDVEVLRGLLLDREQQLRQILAVVACGDAEIDRRPA